MVAATVEEAIETRMEYLASLPRGARHAWVEAAYEVWLLDQVNDQDDEDFA